MKKNLVSLAVAATVVASAAHAGQYVNPEKTGEVILFPFYNADNGNATNMHLVNTTDETKAVKIRFVEHVNSDEVLDFNLYMSPRDHFAFGVIKNPDGEGAAVITSDASCTVPALGSANGAFPGSTTTNADGSITRVQPFVNYQYDDDTDDGIERTLTGHVEVIEMGRVTGALRLAAIHGATGVPSCTALVTAWAQGGTWDTNEDAQMAAPNGGLYGLAYHINVEEAASFGFEPTAIDDWFSGVGVSEHSDPGDLNPSLANGTGVATIHNGDGTWRDVTFAGAAAGAEATSAVLMTAELENDVMINPVIGGQTDWVISFPTKRLHVDQPAGTAVIRPFTDRYIGSGVAASLSCEEIEIVQWDREEQTFRPTTGFSPGPENEEIEICNEVAVVAMGSTDSALNVERGLTSLAFSYEEGWMEISMDQTMTEDAVTITGLPAIGFAAYKVQNGAMSYGNAAEHKTTNVTSVQQGN